MCVCVCERERDQQQGERTTLPTTPHNQQNIVTTSCVCVRETSNKVRELHYPQHPTTSRILSPHHVCVCVCETSNKVRELHYPQHPTTSRILSPHHMCVCERDQQQAERTTLPTTPRNQQNTVTTSCVCVCVCVRERETSNKVRELHYPQHPTTSRILSPHRVCVCVCERDQQQGERTTLPTTPHNQQNTVSTSCVCVYIWQREG